MRRCNVGGCNAKAVTRAMCHKHYQAVWRRETSTASDLRPSQERVHLFHQAGVPDHVVESARAGTNDACVDCAAAPLDGGLRCVPCFTRCALARREHASDVQAHRNRERQLRVAARNRRAA